MKQLLSIILVTLVLTGCNLFESQEKKAIKIVQSAKVQLSTGNEVSNLLLSNSGINNATWLDFATLKAKEESNEQYEWSAKTTEELGICIVSFNNLSGMGYHWEVNIKQEIVKYINENEYLSRKYKFTRFDNDNYFQFTNITVNKLGFLNDFSNDKKVAYTIKADIINNTDKTWIASEISGKLSLVFKDKTVEGEANWESGFNSNISMNDPWEPKTKRSVYIQTKGIEDVYFDYKPEYVFFTVSLEAEDPVGFKYDKDIEEIDLRLKWHDLIKKDSMSKVVTQIENPKLFVEGICSQNTKKTWVTVGEILEGDFDADGTKDFAARVKNTQDGELKIAIIHTNKNEIYWEDLLADRSFSVIPQAELSTWLDGDIGDGISTFMEGGMHPIILYFVKKENKYQTCMYCY